MGRIKLKLIGKKTILLCKMLKKKITFFSAFSSKSALLGFPNPGFLKPFLV